MEEGIGRLGVLMVELSLASRTSNSTGSISLSSLDMVPKERGRFPTKIVRYRRTTVSRQGNKTTRQSTYLRSVNNQMEWIWGLILVDGGLKGKKQHQKVSEGGEIHSSGKGTDLISAPRQANSKTKIPRHIYWPHPSIIYQKEVLERTCVREIIKNRR